MNARERRTEEELKRVKETLGTLIYWLLRELGTDSVIELMEKLEGKEKKK